MKKRDRSPELVVSGSKAGRDIVQTLIRNIKVPGWFLVPPLLLLIAIVVLGWYFYTLSLRPDVMTCELNIAVAEFAPLTDNPDAANVARTYSQRLFEFLHSEFQVNNATFRNVCVAHDRVGVLRNPDTAEALARDIHAHIVIFGSVAVLNDEAQIAPQFYITDALRAEARELTGPHSLALPRNIPTNAILDYSDSTQDTLRTESAVLIEFTKGLSYLSANNGILARTALENAIRYSENQSFKGKEVLYLFAAAVNTYLGDYEAAQERINTALTINPRYGRAYIAEGNIHYTQADRYFKAGDWTTAQEEFSLALPYYQKAADPENNIATAFTLEKAYVSIGNVYALQAQLDPTSTYAQQALDYYQKVIAAYRTNPVESLRQLAARAYFGAGLIYQRRGDTVTAREGFNLTLQLTTNDTLRAAAQAQLDQRP